jgi:hypothetical protein
MFGLFLGVATSAIVGAYKSVATTDTSVESVRPYLERVLPVLFPDARGLPEIQQAERQTVHGYNLRLSVQWQRGPDLTVVVWIRSPNEPPRITAVAPGKTPRRLMGGYNWGAGRALDPDEITVIEAALRAQRGFGGHIAEVLAVRTQVVAGQNRHIVFADKEGAVWAAVIFTNLADEKKVTYCQKAE